MRVITGTLGTTTTAWLPAPSNIASPELRRLFALKSQAKKKVSTPLLPSHDDLALLRLKSRLSVVRTVSHHPKFPTEELWRAQWKQQEVTNFNLTEDLISILAAFTFARRDWCNLNQIRTGHGIAEEQSCTRCNDAEQSVIHMVLKFSETGFEGSPQDIHKLFPTKLYWLRVSTLQLILYNL